MRISILCTDPHHPINIALEAWLRDQSQEQEIVIFRDKENLPGGDLLFLVSCSQIVDQSTRKKYRHALVLHASDLPIGRGWSPHIWTLLQGKGSITLSLIAAEDGVDTGDIWAKLTLDVPPHALHDEINDILFSGEIKLMDKAIELAHEGATAIPQDIKTEPSYYPKRNPKDSEIDPDVPLRDSFAKIRLMDPDRYPAFFRLHGYTYSLELRKISLDEELND